MDDLASQHCTAIRKGARLSAGHVRWSANWIFGGVIGIALCVLLCVLLGIAIACAPAAIRSNNERCLQALAGTTR